MQHGRVDIQKLGLRPVALKGHGFNRAAPETTRAFAPERISE
jgi:hypothetical protein